MFVRACCLPNSSASSLPSVSDTTSQALLYVIMTRSECHYVSPGCVCGRNVCSNLTHNHLFFLFVPESKQSSKNTAFINTKRKHCCLTSPERHYWTLWDENMMFSRRAQAVMWWRCYTKWSGKKSSSSQGGTEPLISYHIPTKSYW